MEFISGEYSRCNSNSVIGIFQARMALPVLIVYVAEKQPDVLTKLPVLIVCVAQKQPDVLTKLPVLIVCVAEKQPDVLTISRPIR